MQTTTQLQSVAAPAQARASKAQQRCFAPVVVSSRPQQPRRLQAAQAASPASRSVVVRATAPEAAKADAAAGQVEWYAVIANAEFMFNDSQNEAMAEQCRERKKYLDEQGKPLDFFFVSEPAWLDKYPEVAKRLKRPAVAMVSTDKQWMIFMKLRLDRVLKVELGKISIDEATKSTAPVPKFKPIEPWTAPYSPYQYGWWEVFMRK